MPYRLEWYELPKDPSLTVLTEMPEEYEFNYLFKTNLKIADLKREFWGQGRSYECYHCYHCGGWIVAEPYQLSENTLNSSQLAGRSGTVYHCRRCGQEIGFFGMQS